MFGIGPPELLVILLIALVVVGPQRLPEVGKAVGKAMREFRKAQDELKGAINFDFDDDPVTPQRPAPHRPRPSVASTEPGEPSEQPPGPDPDVEMFDRLGVGEPEESASDVANIDIDRPSWVDDGARFDVSSDPDPTAAPEERPAPDPAPDPGPVTNPAPDPGPATDPA